MDIFEGKAAGYDSWFDENPLLLEAEAEAIRQVMPEFQSGVEIGVGTGIFASRLGIGTGVDPSPDMGSWAERRGIRFIQGEAEALPLPDAAYDLALMATVDCFLTDPEAAFREVHRVLQPGGQFVIAFLGSGKPNLAPSMSSLKWRIPFTAMPPSIRQRRSQPCWSAPVSGRNCAARPSIHWSTRPSRCRRATAAVSLA